jgi:YHS domain-containing protein
MQVDENTSLNKSRIECREFFFCSRDCKQRFDSDPHRYLTQGGRPITLEQSQARH